MISIDRGAYERSVLATLRGELVERDPGLEHAGNRIIVEDVRLEKSEWPHRVHILFREESRPRCLFGFTALAVEKGRDAEPTSETIDTDPSLGYSEPEEWASIFVVTCFEEQVEAVGYDYRRIATPKASPGWTTTDRRIRTERRGANPAAAADWARTAGSIALVANGPCPWVTSSRARRSAAMRTTAATHELLP